MSRTIKANSKYQGLAEHQRSPRDRRRRPKVRVASVSALSQAIAFSHAQLSVGDVVFVNVPYREKPGCKIRPAVVLDSSGGGKLVVAPLSTKAPEKLADPRGAGLRRACGWMGRVIDLRCGDVLDRVGSVSHPQDLRALQSLVPTS